MVDVRLYKPSDYGMINEWYKKRAKVDLDRRILSSTGFLVDDIACGFIYYGNSKLAHLDSFICNGDKSKEDIKMAFRLICEKIVKFAEEKEFRMLIGYTKYDSIMQLALAHGCTEDGPYQAFYRGI